MVPTALGLASEAALHGLPRRLACPAFHPKGFVSVRQTTYAFLLIYSFGTRLLVVSAPGKKINFRSGERDINEYFL